MPERTFAQWVARGMPRAGDGKRERYPWPEIYRWLIEQARRQGKESVRPADIDEAKKRLVTAEAELKELELAERRGELMTVEQADRVVSEAYSRVRGQLNGMRARLPAMPGPWKTIPDRQKVVDKAVLEVLGELYRADDIPEPEESERGSG